MYYEIQHTERKISWIVQIAQVNAGCFHDEKWTWNIGLMALHTGCPVSWMLNKDDYPMTYPITRMIWDLLMYYEIKNTERKVSWIVQISQVNVSGCFRDEDLTWNIWIDRPSHRMSCIPYFPLKMTSHLLDSSLDWDVLKWFESDYASYQHVSTGVFDISISHIDYQNIDTFWKYRYDHYWKYW